MPINPKDYGLTSNDLLAEVGDDPVLVAMGRAAGLIDRAPRSFTDPRSQVFVALLSLPAEQRLEVIAKFCRGCGADDPACHCTNDE